jgi:hypothetical protein
MKGRESMSKNCNSDKNGNPILPGMMVWKTHCYDGTEKAGKPEGNPLRVDKLKHGYIYPFTGEHLYGESCVAVLSDGSDHYCWNLIAPQPTTDEIISGL